ncbi:MAG: BMP family ABC transporter substrate-binding protein [Oscillospiraceae bacterium]|nr:BMP family ABC transporter substrate-binding protein [Oscillospiraceae bacterium]
MSESDYREAQKLALKEARRCVAAGLSPCLSVMDDFIPEERSMRAVDLGLIEIPTEFLVGTKTRGRVNAFAANFMPLLDPKSEFGDKWQRLCEAHLAEGIREPILAYEYLNRYYVAEGNKRVSVLKYFGAPQVTGRVLRVLPERGPDTVVYYEFVTFQRLSGLNTVEFSRPGGYAALQRLVGKGPDEPWTREDRRQFSAAWFSFRQVYDSLGGGKLRSTPGDALLAYLEVYGYPSIRGKTRSEIRAAVASVWEEIALQQEPEPIDLKLAPQPAKPGLVRKLLGTGEGKKTKVAFVHDGDPASSAWTAGHERGRAYVQHVLADSVVASAYCGAFDQAPEQTVEQAIADGNTVLFTTSPRLQTASLRAAVAHPDVTVFNCSLNSSHRYIRTYYARMYEVKFIIGALAGALGRGEPIGYVADYPIAGQIAGVNAFALGARLTDPSAEVCLEWSSVGGAEAAQARLMARGCRLFSSQDLVRAGREGSRGLTRVEGSGSVNLATPLWQWGSYYEQLLRLLRERALQSEYQESPRALNYFWGISAGVVGLRLSEALPWSARHLAEVLESGIRAGSCEPFRAPLFSQSGPELAPGQTLPPEGVVRMDWLAENVLGDIPAYEELSALGRATVDSMGLPRSRGGEAG